MAAQSLRDLGVTIKVNSEYTRHVGGSAIPKDLHTLPPCATVTSFKLSYTAGTVLGDSMDKNSCLSVTKATSSKPSLDSLRVLRRCIPLSLRRRRRHVEEKRRVFGRVCHVVVCASQHGDTGNIWHPAANLHHDRTTD